LDWILLADRNSIRVRLKPNCDTSNRDPKIRNLLHPGRAFSFGHIRAVPFADFDQWRSWTAKPAHYGFHATIKAPFEMAEGKTKEQLFDDLESFCQSKSPLKLPGMAPSSREGFNSLTITDQSPELTELVFDCVKTFEPYRAPIKTADIERRNPETLSAKKLSYLREFGYPTVGDEFWFHMTLSSQTSDNAFGTWLSDTYSKLVPEAPMFDRLCVFYQPDRQTPFVQLSEHMIGSQP